jgi:cytochrome c1
MIKIQAKADLEPGWNMAKPIIQVKHAELQRSDNSVYRSECPICKNGILLVYRNPKTFVLEAFDRCVWCGQSVEYTDIGELRKKEENHPKKVLWEHKNEARPMHEGQ